MKNKLSGFALFIAFLIAPVSAWSGCFSDFDCGIGYKCVKEPYSSNGVCMKSVNEFGIQQYNSPSPNSIYPRYGGDSCNFDTDCPIGFRCDRTYKVCVR